MDIELVADGLGQVRKTAKVFVAAGIFAQGSAQTHFLVKQIENGLRVVTQCRVQAEISFGIGAVPVGPTLALVGD